MEYLTTFDVESVTDRVALLAHEQQVHGRAATGILLGAADIKETRSHAKLRKRVDRVARAYTRALQANGGPFATYDEAMDATAVEFEASSGFIYGVFRAALSVVSIVFPQTRLFILIFKLLFDVWNSKNNLATPIAPVT